MGEENFEELSCPWMLIIRKKIKRVIWKREGKSGGGELGGVIVPRGALSAHLPDKLQHVQLRKVV